MRGIATFTFLGRIAKDPSMKTLLNGQKRLQVVAAANIPYLKNDKWEEDTTWVTFAWFGDFAVKMADRLRKGMWVHVVGEIRSSIEEIDGKRITRYNFRPKQVVPFEVVTQAIRDQLGGDVPEGDGGSDD
ncbi:MAG: single-stranded DNA-binding protein [bacterium]